MRRASAVSPDRRRDVKPPNISLARSKRVCIADYARMVRLVEGGRGGGGGHAEPRAVGQDLQGLQGLVAIQQQQLQVLHHPVFQTTCTVNMALSATKCSSILTRIHYTVISLRLAGIRSYAPLLLAPERTHVDFRRLT